MNSRPASVSVAATLLLCFAACASTRERPLAIQKSPAPPASASAPSGRASTSSSPPTAAARSEVFDSRALPELRSQIRKALGGQVGALGFELFEARRVRWSNQELTLVALRDNEAMQCKLGLLRSGLPLGFIPALDHVPCKRMTRVAEDDLNGDGIVDFLYAVTLPSNRYPADVDEYAFYLSQPAGAGYCYAKRLENALGLVKFPIGSGALRRATDQLVAERGVSVLACDAEK